MTAVRRRPQRKDRWLNVRGHEANLRGPNRKLTLDEQLEIQRLVKEARAERHGTATVADLARRYGVSNRTMPVGLEKLAIRLKAWAVNRDLELTNDDIATLLYTIVRHRDIQAVPPVTAAALRRP